MRFLLDPQVQLLAGVFVITLLLAVLLRRLLRRWSRPLPGEEESPRFWRECLRVGAGPVSFLVWYYGFLAMAHVATGDADIAARLPWAERVLNDIAGLGVFGAVFWLLYGVARVADRHVQARAERTPGKLDNVLLPLVGLAVRLMLPILALMLLVRLWPLSPEGVQFARRTIAILLIAAVTWLLRRAVLLVEKTVVGREEFLKTTNFEGRALLTRVSVLRKIALVLISLFAFAAVLMTFDEVRDIGRSILASAGVAGIVIGFAAQRSLGNLFAGLQIALTQPVRIGDQIKVVDEVGTVEEITLTYVVVRLWDYRRLIVPISFFIEQPVQNWTRSSYNMLSPVTLRVDFSFPVPVLREHMRGVVEKSKRWDRKTFAVHLMNTEHASMEIRILASAASPGDSFELQCELREEAIDFIHRLYPQCLPKAREEGKPMKEWRISEEIEPRRTWPNEVRLPPENAA